MTIPTFDLAAVRARLATITTGPWTYDAVENEGSYGDGGPDERTGFSSYAVLAGTRCVRGGELVVEEVALFDTINSGAIEVEEEFDDEGASAWDKVGLANAQFVAAAPADLAAACDEIERLREENNKFRRALFGGNGTLPPGSLATSQGPKEEKE